MRECRDGGGALGSYGVFHQSLRRPLLVLIRLLSRLLCAFTLSTLHHLYSVYSYQTKRYLKTTLLTLNGHHVSYVKKPAEERFIFSVEGDGKSQLAYTNNINEQLSCVTALTGVWVLLSMQKKFVLVVLPEPQLVNIS